MNSELFVGTGTRPDPAYLSLLICYLRYGEFTHSIVPIFI